ncbi:MAG: uroporphyrinogen-III synthase [Archangium sp.]|nr:uroporphyrinogen-III synthase [Archangium sp.]
METTWLITREADDARSERDAFLSRGERAVIVPCVETKLLEWPWSEGESPSPCEAGGGQVGGTPALEVSPSPQPSPRSRRERELTFFTSRRAVASWSKTHAPLNEVAALSPATSTALEAEHITPTITAEGGVVSLAEAVLAWWTARGTPRTLIRYPTSDAGLRSPEQTEALNLLRRVGEVDRRVVYVVAPPPNLRAALEQSTQGAWAISFASPSAVQHFFASGAAIARAPSRVACLGAATERAWNTARREGWPQAVNSREFPPTPKVTS